MMVGRVAAMFALVTVLGPPLRAQVEGGVHGAMNSGLVSGEATLGIGGRVGAYVFRTGDFAVRADGQFDYFFASCALPDVSCYAWHGQVNLVGTRKLGEPLLGYAGVGGAYQRFRFSTSGGADPTDDSFGLNLIVGAQLPVVRAVRPFFEAKYAIFEGTNNQLVLALGILFSSAKVVEEEF
jgi:hypothetical protein